jgi:hypothetical protein
MAHPEQQKGAGGIIISRRGFIRAGLLGGAAYALSGCGDAEEPSTYDPNMKPKLQKVSWSAYPEAAGQKNMEWQAVSSDDRPIHPSQSERVVSVGAPQESIRLPSLADQWRGVGVLLLAHRQDGIVYGADITGYMKTIGEDGGHPLHGIAMRVGAAAGAVTLAQVDAAATLSSIKGVQAQLYQQDTPWPQELASVTLAAHAPGW